MMRRVLCTLMLWAGLTGWLSAQAAEPEAGKKYFTLHLTTALSEEAAHNAALRAGDLPWLRIIKQGKLYVVRAGFWETRAEADAAFRSILRTFPSAGIFRSQYAPGVFTLVAPPETVNGTDSSTDHPR